MIPNEELHPVGEERDGAIPLSPLDVMLATVLVVVSALVSLYLHLGLHTKLAVAMIRCILQLTILGYILLPIMMWRHWWMVLMYACIMIGAASMEAASRPQHTFKGMMLHTVLAVSGAASAIITYTLLVVLRVRPWWDPQYFIPLLGMLLGNTTSAISVGLTAITDEFATGRQRVEALLSMGASRWEASRGVVKRALTLAMTPLLNTMSVTGLVSIPGMMTGQILGGADPEQAARYQIVIMFLIGATSTLGALASVMMALSQLMDGSHRLRSDRLKSREREMAGMAAALRSQAVKTYASTLVVARRLYACCCCSSWRSQRRHHSRLHPAHHDHRSAFRDWITGSNGYQAVPGVDAAAGTGPHSPLLPPAQDVESLRSEASSRHTSGSSQLAETKSK